MVHERGTFSVKNGVQEGQGFTLDFGEESRCINLCQVSSPGFDYAQMVLKKKTKEGRQINTPRCKRVVGDFLHNSALKPMKTFVQRFHVFYPSNSFLRKFYFLVNKLIKPRPYYVMITLIPQIPMDFQITLNFDVTVH